MKDPYVLQKLLDLIPNQPQRQDSLNDQLETMRIVANKFGCYDAADFMRRCMVK